MQTKAQSLINAAHASSLASSWAVRNQAVTDDLAARVPELLMDLSRSENYLEYSALNVKQRPTIGLFGASQAGKSYLVSSLAAGPNGKLTTVWDDAPIDFIRHVNPSGGNSEATGFATRFTHAEGKCPASFPVELKVLTEMELAMILINSFFADIRPSDVKMPSDENFYLEHLQGLESLVDTKARSEYNSYPQAILSKINSGLPLTELTSLPLDFDKDTESTEIYFNSGREITVGGDSEWNYVRPEQVIELADYVSSNSNGKVGGLDSMPNVWLKLRDMLPFMTLDGRIKALSVFWQNLPIFNETYRTLASELLKLKGHDHIYAPKSTFVTDTGDGDFVQNSTGTIMQITKLKTMFDDKSTLPCALVREGSEVTMVASTRPLETVEINISRLAALSLELCFRLQNYEVAGGDDWGQGLATFDVLDLPGARSRDEVALQDTIDDGAEWKPGGTPTDNMKMRGSEFFRRGKVAYLFDRYTRRNEIEQLLFCIGVNSQQDVTSVLTILSDWIDKNVGNTPQKRADQTLNPLTIIFTRYDEVFNRQLRNLQQGLPLDMNQELNIAINRIQKQNWFNEWTPGRPFNKVLLARKPNLGDLNPWIASEEGTNRELGIKANSADDIEKIKQSLLAVPEFARHIGNFPEVLEAMLTMNDGGVRKIASTVTSGAMSDSMRESIRISKAKSLVKECFSNLSPFATRDGATKILEAKSKSKELGLGLLQCNSITPCMDLIRGLLELDQERLEELYQDGFSTGSNVHRFVHLVCKKYTENLTALAKKNHKRINEVADLIANVYRQRLPSLKEDPANRNYYSICYVPSEERFKTPEEVKDTVLDILVGFYDEVYKAFNSPQVGLKSYMISALEKQENTNEAFAEIVRVQVQLMEFILSDFNLYLGANLLPNTATAALLKAESAKTVATAAASAPTAKAAAAPAAKPAPAPASTSYGDDDEYVDPADLGDDDDDNVYEAVGASSAPSANPAPTPAPRVATSKLSVLVSTVPARRQLEPGESVLCSEEGPRNHFKQLVDKRVYMKEDTKGELAFGPLCGPDDTGILPHLDKSTQGYEFKFASDYISTMMYMMCQVNVLTDSKYKFSSEENLLLCQILNTWEAC